MLDVLPTCMDFTEFEEMAHSIGLNPQQLDDIPVEDVCFIENEDGDRMYFRDYLDNAGDTVECIDFTLTGHTLDAREFDHARLSEDGDALVIGNVSGTYALSNGGGGFGSGRLRFAADETNVRVER